jgi:long-subunit acyl-CoA synthetase (AMP-forming)/ribosomal protein S18 acetylase RimI-like enzyme
VDENGTSRFWREGIFENIISVTEKFISGLTAFGKKDVSEQLESFAEALKQIPQEKKKITEEQADALLKIFVAAAKPDFAKQFMSKVDTEVFHKFGEYLNLQFARPNDKSVKITHEYLNLFRYPSLLKKIYGEQKWENLIYDLVTKSNYNTKILFEQRTRDYKNKPLFKVIKGNSVTEYSWEKTDQIIQKYQQALYSVLVAIAASSENKQPALHEEKVAFLLDNCIEMAMLDLACLMSGIVNVMIPSNSVTEHIRFILKQSSASVLIVHDEKQLSKIKSLKSVLQLKRVILLIGNSSEEWVTSFSEFLSSAKEQQNDFDIDMNSLSTIMYTSGTTGEPKGIMFSQTNIIYKRFCRAMAIPEIGDEDRFLSYLPLFHTFGRYLEMTGCVFWAAEYCFLENPSVETMISNMQLIKPTVFISIPKKWMQIYDYVTSKVDIEVEDHQKIKSELDEATGGEIKWGLSAAGYLPADIFKFFQDYGIELMSGFGMTEATGGITMTPPKKYKPNSLGKALPGIDIKVGDDGELLVKGPYVMLGYYKMEIADTFKDDGWLPTGDIMQIDDDGFIEIIDRKKEIYKNIKGETIAPQKIENLFRDFENIKQVFLVGDHRQFNTLLIFPNLEDVESLFYNMDEKQKQEYFSSVIVTVNKFLAPFERILDFRIIDRAFSDNHGELTPKATYKRKAIEKNFSDLIESMYVANKTSIYINGIEVRIPNWFLREKGCLSRDVFADKNDITIPKLNLSLPLSKQTDENVYRVGSYNYKIYSHFIDFQLLLTDPNLWIGNRELVDFTGKSIVQWYRQTRESTKITFHSIFSEVIPSESEVDQFYKIYSASEFSLHGIHIAFISLLAGRDKNIINYFQKILNDIRNQHHKLVFNLLARSIFLTEGEKRKKLFIEVIKHVDDKKFEEIFSSLMSLKGTFLDAELIHTIAVSSKGESRLNFFEKHISSELDKLEAEQPSDISDLQSLFKLLAAYGITHPPMYRRVRKFLLHFTVLPKYQFIEEIADNCYKTLISGFREWIGTNQQLAVDVETGEEYSWEDVLTFEEGVDADDFVRIKNAIVKTAVLREAIFLFSKGVQLRLDDILPGGIWISLLDSRNDKSIYRITVQTRFQGAFDFTIHLNKNLPPAIVKEELKWLIVAGIDSRNERLLPQFGGYWEEYELWTEAFVPRDSLAKFLERENKRVVAESQDRLFELWPHFVWNATAAYMNFWGITNFKVQLTNPMPENITIPTHDYQLGTLLYSVSKRTKSDSPKDFFITFYNMFVKTTLDKYSFLDKKSIWNYVFSGITECQGEETSLKLIEKFKDELEADPEIQYKDEILFRAEEFIKSVRGEGFTPKSLFFAIKRFHRWSKLNPDADRTAQAAMLFELYETYQLFGLEKEFKHTRSIFFLKTAFDNSASELKNALLNIAQKQRKDELNAEASQKLYLELHSISNLTEEEKFFLTRLSYPHLKPADTAALVQTVSQDGEISNLVVQLSDEDGNHFLIRSPASPKEISRLHALFLESNLIVNFRTEHRFLVVLSERGFIIGGLFYERTDEQTAHMEKIVVSNRYRRKGISEALMNELFNRLKGEHFNFVTTGFFRPEYFYRFGFKVEKKYSGLVLNLKNFSKKE